MKIGFALNEVLALLTLLTGALTLAWWLRKRRGGVSGRPWWVSWIVPSSRSSTTTCAARTFVSS